MKWYGKVNSVKGIQLANSSHRSPLKYLLNDRPGLGMSVLVAYLPQLLGCNKWNTIKLNGTQCKDEMITRQISRK